MILRQVNTKTVERWSMNRLFVLHIRVLFVCDGPTPSCRCIIFSSDNIKFTVKKGRKMTGITNDLISFNFFIITVGSLKNISYFLYFVRFRSTSRYHQPTASLQFCLSHFARYTFPFSKWYFSVINTLSWRLKAETGGLPCARPINGFTSLCEGFTSPDRLSCWLIYLRNEL